MTSFFWVNAQVRRALARLLTLSDRTKMISVDKGARHTPAVQRTSYPAFTVIAVVFVIAIAVFGACDTSSRGTSATSPKSAPPEMPFTIDGRGDVVSDSFILDPGKYRISINVSGNSDQSGRSGAFIVALYTVVVGMPSVLVETVTTSGNWETTSTVLDRQHFYLDVIAAGEWTVTFHPV